MTCDTSRPCRRCIQRGLQDTCEDAPRKRKKYLSDVPPSLIQPHLNGEEGGPSNAVLGSNRHQPLSNGQYFQATLFQQSNSLPNYIAHRSTDLTKAPTVPGLVKAEQPEGYSGETYDMPNRFYPRENGITNPLDLASDRHQTLSINKQSTGDHQYPVAVPILPPQNNGQVRDENTVSAELDPGHDANYGNKRNGIQRKRTNFLSSAADLEYSTLSSILQDNFMNLNPNPLATSTEGTPNSMNLSPALSPHVIDHKVNSPSSLASTYYAGNSTTRMQTEAHNGNNRSYNGSEAPPCDPTINQYFLGSRRTDYSPCFPEVMKYLEKLSASDPAAYYARNSQLMVSFAISMSLENSDDHDENLPFREPEEIYARISKPFSYTPGFHKLIAYLRNRFPREMLVKMAKSMAVYRPSFIACTNSLREADLIFMEQCFQRTLLTYDNFIKVSGTPTIVWRRTGEIAYVGREFTVLTGWTQEQLMGQKPMFIVELLDDKSVVEYFELFSRIAFGDFLGATMTECTLLTPEKDVKIRAGCIWTLKRDVFGIPMMIIGNFLPIV